MQKSYGGSEAAKSDLADIVRQAVEEALKGQKNNMPAYMRRKDAAVYMGIGLTTFDKLVREGLPAIVIDGPTLFSRATIDAWLADQQMD
ncbi:helix-turn-helix transcriptional regulator [Lacticaseibacillus saniviri]